MVTDATILSDDEMATDFVLLPVQERVLNEPLLELIAQVRATVESGQRLALIRWKDDIESLVAFPVENPFPSPEVLRVAYCRGFETQCLERHDRCAGETS
ncbi:MAG: hypothetical protein IPI40_03360 [Betaproteobacteria bacterium]|nr:hypothetical protein [Betaproteobacteria bacterium]